MANEPIINLNKLSDRIYADIGEQITYTFVIKNTGDLMAINSILIDTIPSGTTYVNNSLTLNNVIQSGVTPAPPIGAPLGTIAQGGIATVTFKTQVTTLPITNEVINNSTLNYNYIIITENGPATLNGSVVSNETQILINTADIDILKFVDKNNAKLGDTLTYLITLHNSGNIIATNVKVQDTIPNGTNFITDSLKVNGVTQPGVTPSPGSGVVISSINAGETYTVSFMVDVMTIPTVNPIQNSSLVSYQYSVNPLSGVVTTKSKNSNIVTTDVRQAIIDGKGFVKTTDKTYATKDTIISYTLNLTNSGNAQASNVVVIDTIPDGTSLVDDSVTVNNIVQTGANPSIGVNVGTIDVGKSSTLKFKVKVITIPNPNTALNSGTVSYDFYLTERQGAVGYGNSNVVVTTINYATVAMSKYVDKTTAQDNEVLSYSIGVKNNGNIPIYNVVIKDTIPNNVQVLDGSLTINGTSVVNGNLKNGITIPVINSESTSLIEFKTLIISIPASGDIKNTAIARYLYIISPTDPTITGTAKSNEVTVTVKGVEFDDTNFVKYCNKNFAAVGDTVVYSFFIRNGGNIDANSVIFYDTVPDIGFFVKDSLIVNGTTVPSKDPNNGIELDTIGVGKEVTLSFQMAITTIPSPEIVLNQGILKYMSSLLTTPATALSNIVELQVKSPVIKMNKISDWDIYNLGDSILYTISVSNNGNADAYDFVVRDILEPQLAFEKGSVMIDGKSVDGNILNGISIESLPMGTSKNISFKAKILERPEDGIIENYAEGTYCYVLNESIAAQRGEVKSNIKAIMVEDVKVTLFKESEVQEATVGSEYMYKVSIANIGTTDVTDFILKDDLPKELQLIKNSVTVNNKTVNGVDLKYGVRIGTIKINETVIVTFKVKVNENSHRCTVDNYAIGEYNYKLTSKYKMNKGVVKSNKCEVKVPNAAFKQLSINEVFKLWPDDILIGEVDKVTANIKILGQHIIKTLSGVSEENKNMQGYKIIINGIISNTVEYTGKSPDQSVVVNEFEKSFSTYIVLPSNYEIGRGINISSLIEEIDYSVLDCETIVIGIVFMLSASII